MFCSKMQMMFGETCVSNVKLLPLSLVSAQWGWKLVSWESAAFLKCCFQFKWFLQYEAAKVFSFKVTCCRDGLERLRLNMSVKATGSQFSVYYYSQ